MKYLVPPIVIPVLLFIGIVAYGMLRPRARMAASGLGRSTAVWPRIWLSAAGP